VALQVIDEGCGSVRFEQTELRQVLADLLSYAIGHCRTAGRIVVRAHRDHHRTTVSVADDGGTRATTSDGASWRIHGRGRSPHDDARPGVRLAGAVRANQATLSVRPDHPVGTIASLVMIAV
jgi:K+-sensing histidine kinase KdpD